ncbi:type IV pilus modification protein PilV [Thiocystis minor]|uniref:type IV pilus modification protein PilV n=1 Tax=Thiocystis minor TaxID=61597 RepID=UPI0019135A43|nr:type IV pilus modification protein PilV [Thiocystis minor]MBK5964020.1 type IV pilus modification protein PilV [Thiocystis minor]
MKRSANLATCAVSRQRGFTLIEVLIAALVLSVGLLGLAGLQAVSLKLNQGSSLRTQATNLAYEITDAMRANRGNAEDYEENAEAEECDEDFTRTGSNVADDDFDEWENRLACLLPEGQGNISSSANQTTVTICWNDSHSEAGESETDPICSGLGIAGSISFSFETQL